MSSLQGLALDTATALVGGPMILGAVGGIGMVMLSMLCTWLIIRTYYSVEQSAMKTIEAPIIISIESTYYALVLLLTKVAISTLEAVGSISNSLQQNWIQLAAMIFMAIVASGFMENQPSLAAAALRIRQCNLLELVYDIPIRLLNTVRLLYDSLYPLANMVIEWLRRLGPLDATQRLLKRCALANVDDFRQVITAIGDVMLSISNALLTYFSGDILQDPIPWVGVFAAVGGVADAMYDIGVCFCAFLEPVISYFTTLLNEPELHIALEAAANVILRVAQMILYSLIYLSAPNFSKIAEELNTFLLSTSDFLAILVLNTVLLVSQLLYNIGLLFDPSSTAAISESLKLPTIYPADFEGAHTSATIPITVHALVHAAHRTRASPLAVTSANELVNIAEPLWQLPNSTTLNSTLGLDRLLLALNVPWPRIVGHTAAGLITWANITLNIISNGYSFKNPVIVLRYIQFGEVFQQLRGAWQTFADLSIVVDVNFPCYLGQLGNAFIYYLEAVVEIFTEFIIAIVFPQWLPGENPPTDCSGIPTNCSYPAPSGWTVFNFFPAYYDWDGNAIKQSLYTFQADADCLAIVLGCNATTLDDDQCELLPFQCALRTSYLLGLEVANQTNAFIFYLPDLVRFSNASGYRTFDNLSVDRIVDLCYQLIDCFVRWLEELDGSDQCMTDTPPETYTNPPNETQPPIDLSRPRYRGEYLCGVDGLAYENDGVRLLITVNNQTLQEEYTICGQETTLEDNSGCLYLTTLATPTYLTATGNPTQTDLTVNVRRDPYGSEWLSFKVLATGNYSVTLLSNLTTLPSVTSFTSSNCTSTLTLPFPDPITPGTGCVNARLYYRPMDNRSVAAYPDSGGYPGLFADHYLPNGVVDGIPPSYDTVSTSEVYPINCTVNPISNLVCDGSGIFYWYNGLRVYALADAVGDLVNPQPGFFCTPGGDINTPLDPDFALLCRNGRLYMTTPTAPYTYRLAVDVSYYKPLGDEIPCSIEIEDLTDIHCEASVNQLTATRLPEGPMPIVYAANVTATGNETANIEYVPCIENNRSVIPLCARAEITYTDATNITIVVDGVTTVFYFNGVEQTLGCEIVSTTDVVGAHSSLSSGTATILAQVEAYYPPPPPPPSSSNRTWDTRIESIVAAVNATVGQIHAMAAYRKQSILCCLAETLRAIGRCIVAFVFTIIRTIKSLLTLPAFAVGEKAFDVPTFREAKDELRDALCSLACTVTRILPDFLTCSDVGAVAGCSSGAACATGLLCHLSDVLLLLPEIIVEILETLKAIADSDTATVDDNGLYNADCRNNNIGDCIGGVFVYIITKIIFTLTQVVRDVAAFVNCFFCAIGTFLGLPCSTLFFAFFNALMNIIDTISGDVLKTIVKVILGSISALTYLFSGSSNAFTLFIEEIGKVFGYIGELFINIGQLIIDFLLSIPVIGDVIRFLLNIAGSICQFIEDAIQVFSPSTNLGCPEVNWSAKKRGLLIQVGGWIGPVSDDLRQTWSTAATACRDRVQTLNTSVSNADVTDDDRVDLAICLQADYWRRQVKPYLNPADGATVCEYKMVAFIDSNTLWSQLPNGEEKTSIYQCASQRASVLRTNLDTSAYNLLPDNFYENAGVNILGLGIGLVRAYGVYSQYYDDRNIPIELVQSSAYANNWQVSGYSTTHLANIASLSKADAANALAADDPRYGLSVDQYAERMAPVIQMRAPQLARTIRYLREFFKKPDPATALKRDNNNNSILTSVTQSHVGRFIGERLDRLSRMKVLPPPSINFTLLTDASLGPSATNAYTHLGVRAVLHDTPILVANFIRLGLEERLLETGSGALGSIAQMSYAATVGALGVVRDLVAGRYQWAGVVDSIWRAKNATETLGYAGAQMVSSVSATIARSPGSGPGVLAELFWRAADLSPQAQARRTGMLHLFRMIQSSFVNTATAVAAAPVTPSTDLECSTTFTDLCEQCKYIDEAIGVINGSTIQMITYYQGSNTSVSYSNARLQYLHLETLYTNLYTTPAEVGDSAELPVRWPWAFFENYRILGDWTPNKQRLVGVRMELYDLFLTLLGVDPTMDLLNNVASAASDNVVTRIGRSSLQVGRTLLSTTEWAIGLRPSSAPVQVATSTLVDNVLNLFEYVNGWLRKCSFREEINGSQKNFSIGETIGLIVVTGLAAGLIMWAIFQGQSLVIIAAVGGSIGMAVLFLTLILTYNWSYSCVPALPYQLADDIVWFLTRTVFPKCDWLLAGVITNDTYTKDACMTCANYADTSEGGYNYAHCMYDVGFYDIGYNIAFTLKTTLPDIVTAFNDTSIPLLSSLVHSNFVQTRLNAFGGYNPLSNESFAIHWSCNAVYTAIPNVMRAQPFFALLALVFPLALLLGTIFVYSAYAGNAMVVLTYRTAIAIGYAPIILASMEQQQLQSPPPQPLLGLNVPPLYRRRWRSPSV